MDRKLLFYIACTEPVHTKKNVAQMLAKRFVSLKKIEGREDYHDFCVSTFFGENVSFFFIILQVLTKTTTLKGGERKKKKR